MKNVSNKKKGFLPRFYRLFLFLIGILIIVSCGLLLYINIKKNEISKNLLLRVNSEFNGNFSVNEIALGSLLSYPDIDITISDLYFKASEIEPSIGQVIIHVPTAQFRANFSKIMSNEFIIDKLNIKNAKLFIERDSLNRMIISEAFSPMPNTKPVSASGELRYSKNEDKKPKNKASNTKNTTRKTPIIQSSNEISKHETESIFQTESDHKSLKISIKDLSIENTKVIIIDYNADVNIPLPINRALGDFTYDKHILSGNVHLHLAPLSKESSENFISSDAPLSIAAHYEVDLNKEKVAVKSKELLFGPNAYNLDFAYNYSDKPFMSLDLKSNKGGINLNSLFLEKEKKNALNKDPDDANATDEHHDEKEVDNKDNDIKTDSNDHSDELGLHGIGHFKTNVSWNPTSKAPFIEAITASLSLDGQNLEINGMDLDNLINQFKKSQSFNFTDIGAVLFAGPAGLAITKGGDFARLAFVKQGEYTKVKHFNAEWQITNGILKTKDVALSTSSNLISASGGYKIKDEHLDFKFNILDKRGCELISQRIYGTKDSLEYSSVNILKTLFGPVNTFFRDIRLSKCDTIYAGKVKHPALEK